MAITLKDLPEYGGKVGFRPQVFISEPNSLIGAAIDVVSGIKVIVDDSVQSNKKWVFPYDKYIQYGPEDLWWAVPWGFGRWVNTPAAYEINGMVICNKEFKEEIEKIIKGY